MSRGLSITVAVLLLAMVTTPAIGQGVQSGEGAGGQLSFIWAMPQGEFADHVDRRPMGAGVLFGGQVPGAPLFLGTELSLLNYGTRQHLELHRLEDVPVQAVRVASSHNIGMGHFVARVQLPTGPIRPYVDALGGVRAFMTRTRVDSDVVVFPRGFRASAQMTDWALSYGAGGGLDIVFHTRAGLFSERPTQIALNVGVRYLFGEEADLVRLDDVQEVGDRFVFDTTRSRTDVIIPQIGLRVSY